MTRNPSDIGHASESVSRMNIKDVFDGQGGAQEVATGGVNDALRLAGGSRGLIGSSMGQGRLRMVFRSAKNGTKYSRRE
jgi:hypothetical protein